MHQLRFLKCPHDVTMSRNTLFFSKRGHNSINAHKIFDNMTVDEPFNFCMTLLHTKPYGLVLSSLLNGHVYIFTLKKKICIALNMYFIQSHLIPVKAQMQQCTEERAGLKGEIKPIEITGISHVL